MIGNSGGTGYKVPAVEEPHVSCQDLFAREEGQCPTT